MVKTLKHIDWEVPGFGELASPPRGWPRYDQMVLALDPLAYWRLDDTSGSALVDQLGGYPGTYDDATLGEPGALVRDPNKAIALAGSGRAGTVANPLVGLSRFSLLVWFAVAGYTTRWQTLLSSLPSSQAGFVIQRDRDGDSIQGVLREAASDGSGLRIVRAGQPVNDGGWHMLAFQAEADGDVSLHLDGTPRDATPLASISPLAHDLALCQDMRQGRAWQGGIDEPACWDRLLSNDEIDRLYQRGRGHFQLGA